MASKNVVRPRPPRKVPRVVGAFPSKLLHDCDKCGRPVFRCRGPVEIVDVEVLEQPTGDVALQSCIGSDELAAVHVSHPRTWFRYHLPHCGRSPRRPAPPAKSRKAVRR